MINKKYLYIGGGVVLFSGLLWFLHKRNLTAQAQNNQSAGTSSAMTALALGAGGGFALGSQPQVATGGGYYPQPSAAVVSATPPIDVLAVNKQNNDFYLQQNLQNTGLQAFDALINAVPSGDTAGGTASANVNATISPGGNPDLVVSGTVNKVLPATVFAAPVVMPANTFVTNNNYSTVNDNHSSNVTLH